MQIIADFHIHSKFSRACSRNLTLANIDKACRIKGVDVIGTGDFTHPEWMRMITEELTPLAPLVRGVASPSSCAKATADKQPSLHKEEGELYCLKGSDEKVKFILTSEVALIYKDKGRVRRIHIVIHAPSIEKAKEFNSYLGKSGYNIKSDGRPILGMNAPKLCKILFDIDEDFLVYPAHIWTPWFSVFGSKSGFDRLEDCFDEYTDRIFAYETGLSSDPEMNWRLSALDHLSLLSNSDAHSLPNIGREANIFELDEVSYASISAAIKKQAPGKLASTIEFYPEEGMYHFDGHRSCGVSLSPAMTRKKRGECPVCHKPLTIGVLSRVEELADRPEGFKPEGAPGSIKLVELDKIIAEASGIKSRSSNKVQRIYNDLIRELGNELQILIEVPIKNIERVAGPLIAEGIRRVRAGELYIEPGFDGEYGKIKIFDQKELIKQEKLF